MAGSDPTSGRGSGPVPDRGMKEADEDPLVELARIVSEDSGFSTPKTEKPDTMRNERTQRSAYSEGLEAELLQELETSLGGSEDAAAPETVPEPSGGRSAPQRTAVEVERDPDDLLRSIEEQLGKFEQRQAERLAASAASLAAEEEDEELEELAASNVVVEPEIADEPRMMAEPEEEPRADEPPQERWQSRRMSRIRLLDEADEPENAPRTSVWEEETESAQPIASDYRFRGPAHAEWDRSALEANYEPETPVPSAHDDERRGEEAAPRRTASFPGFGSDESSDANLFVPHRKSGRAYDPFVEAEPVRETSDEARVSAETLRRRRIADAFPEFEDEPSADTGKDERAAMNARLAEALESDFAEPSYGKPWKPGEAGAKDEPKVATATSAASRRAAAARAQAAQRGRGARTALFTIIGAVIVVLIGGAAALYLRSTEGGPATPPPVIAADRSPVKIEPPKSQTTAENDTAGEAVYDRVSGNTQPTDEQVVDSTEEPREVARIVLPSSQTEGNGSVVRPVGDEGSDAAAADTSSAAPTADEIGPRRVPTFTVRPDGTIIANGDGEDASVSGQQMASATPQAQAPAPAASDTAAPAAPATTNAQAPVAADDAATSRPAAQQPTELASAASEPASTSATGSADNTEAPVNLLNEAEAQPAAALPAATQAIPDGYLVQVSSQRSMDQAEASFADIQQQYPSVLGGLKAVIQEADLGDKGIYFRVRVGPWASRDEAIKVCESLKAAGGSCFVTQ